MKRIIALFVVMLAFGLNANAQQKKATAAPAATNQQALNTTEAAYSTAADKDIATLSQYVKLTSDQKVTLHSLFTEKHRYFGQNLSNERKAVVAENIEMKLKSTLEPAQLAKIEGNAQLMNILTH
jgi:hypothetical protein